MSSHPPPLPAGNPIAKKSSFLFTIPSYINLQLHNNSLRLSRRMRETGSGLWNKISIDQYCCLDTTIFVIPVYDLCTLTSIPCPSKHPLAYSYAVALIPLRTISTFIHSPLFLSIFTFFFSLAVVKNCNMIGVWLKD